ncbi:MAG: GHKL domain-containing protein [Clostridiales bacterium]|nr:GHKL domain-containing protein [Clostridiales bacterium]
MVFILGILILVLFALYIKGIKNKKKLLKIQDELEEKYAYVVGENMDLKLQMDIVKEEYNRERDMAKEIQNLHKKTRTLKHDMKNHIMVITAYINEKNYEEAKNYLSKITDNLNRMYTYIDIGNSLLNYIINTKLQLAIEQGIDVKVEIENLAFNQIGSVDFSALLNNILDNAIEGSLMSEKKLIEVSILRKRGYDTILVKNKIGKSVLIDNPNLISTKENKEEHGYGFKQIKEIVDKYNGMIDIYEKDNFFCVYVIYPY